MPHITNGMLGGGGKSPPDNVMPSSSAAQQDDSALKRGQQGQGPGKSESGLFWIALNACCAGHAHTTHTRALVCDPRTNIYLTHHTQCHSPCPA